MRTTKKTSTSTRSLKGWGNEMKRNEAIVLIIIVTVIYLLVGGAIYIQEKIDSRSLQADQAVRI